MVYAETPTPGKKGTNVNEEKYSTIYNAILDVFAGEQEILFKELPEKIAATLVSPFDGSISWYTTTVKLDMESKGILERVPGSRPQRLRLTGRGNTPI